MVRLLDDITEQVKSSLFDDYVCGTRVIDLEYLLQKAQSDIGEYPIDVRETHLILADFWS